MRERLILMKIIGKEINSNTYTPNRDLKHSHEGSIGNLCNEQISAMMQEVIAKFGFDKVQNAIEDLLK